MDNSNGYNSLHLSLITTLPTNDEIQSPLQSERDGRQNPCFAVLCKTPTWNDQIQSLM